jgi:tripartite-type tricarboxylate transporter receptor subunit TctC
MYRRGHYCMLALIGLAWMADTAFPSTHEFFKGKTIRIVVAYSPGASFDVYSRTIARHLGKQIPGNPTIIVENMTGAGGLVLANHLYKVAKPDGLTIGTFNGGLLMGQILGWPGIEFDARKYEYIGVPSKLDSVCVFTKGSGITSFEKWKASKVPVKMGGTAAGSAMVDAPRLLMALFGLPTQLITGYKGFADVRLAMEGGEVDGVCASWDGIHLAWGKKIESGDIVVVLQTPEQRLRDLPKVPSAIEFAKDEKERQLIQVGLQDPALLGHLYSLPPGTPKDRVQFLGKAFIESIKTPAYAADALNSKLRVDPVGGEELEKIVERLFKLGPATTERLKEILRN